MIGPVRHPVERSGTNHGSAERADRTFQTTHWSVILSAGDLASANNRQALSQFCQAYWEPVYAYVRRRGKRPEDAEDLTQDFFAWFLENEVLSKVRRQGGKFRSYLLTVLPHFLANEWNRDNAQKRGGGKMIVAFDEEVEARYQKGLSEDATPEELFDRKWAFSVLDQVRKRLREEYCAKGQGQLYDVLQGFLPGAEQQAPYEGASQALGMTEEAVRMAVHRLRRRWGKFLREEVAARGTKPEEVDEEIRYLLDIMSR
jgi:RNA polymerase sigma factor (sigma-70 family)